MPARRIALMITSLCSVLSLGAAQAADGRNAELQKTLNELTNAAEPKVIEWRRDFHAHPELSNREFRTSKRVAKHLQSLGLEVETGIAHTGVVGILRGGKPGPMVALRADIDGLPVTEASDLPFASKATTTYRDRETGVMHACGHDVHTAILMGAAEVLTSVRDDLPGSVMFIFQPAEEGAPEGEEGGAALMLKEGLFDRTKPDVIFGLHVWSANNVGEIAYRPGPAMASYDNFKITVQGVQTHASRPWGGVDPIVVSSQIILGLQTIASRQIDVTKTPSVISVGSIHGGIRNNIIPDTVEMLGTVRAFDPEIRADIHKRIEKTVNAIADSAGAKARVEFDYGYPVTHNDIALTESMVPVLQRVAGADKVVEAPLITGAEDFSYFQQQVPGFYFFLGGTPEGQDARIAPSNHSPLFYVEESTMLTGLNALVQMTLEYMETR